MATDKPLPVAPKPDQDSEQRERTHEELDAELDQELADSFPASDPPKITRPGHED